MNEDPIDKEFECKFDRDSSTESQPLIQFLDIRTDIPTANWDDKVEQLPLELTVVGKLEGFCFGKNILRL
jgi:hypothetical protein